MVQECDTKIDSTTLDNNFLIYPDDISSGHFRIHKSDIKPRNMCKQISNNPVINL